MASDLLKKEEKYHKLYDELEVRTRELMQEVDIVKKLQNNHTNATYTSEVINYKIKYKPCHNDNFHQNTFTKTSGNQLSDTCVFHKDDLYTIPESTKDMGIKGMTCFFKAKIKKLQNDFDKQQTDYKTKCDEIKRLHKENQKLTEEKEKWFHISTGHKTQIVKLENQVTALNSKIQSKENENISLKKNIDQLQKDLKNETLGISHLEIKLKKTIEENEKLKVAFKNAKQEEKDLRDTHRKQLNDMSTVIKKIEKHKLEILNGFKKQLLLIDNLKRQKAFIEKFKITEKADNEFAKILDWKLET